MERPEARADPGCVALKTAGAGIGGANLRIFKNEYEVAPPVIMGHEVCGYVEQVGDGVDSAPIGQRFVAETFFSRKVPVLSLRLISVLAASR